jgi:hypothetical protein
MPSNPQFSKSRYSSDVHLLKYLVFESLVFFMIQMYRFEAQETLSASTEMFSLKSITLTDSGMPEMEVIRLLAAVIR